MINGETGEISPQAETDYKASGGSFEGDGFNKIEADAEKTEKIADEAINGDDYSYYGTIKPLAENAGLSVLKKEVAEPEKKAEVDADNTIKAAKNRQEFDEKGEELRVLEQEKFVKNALNTVRLQAVTHVAAIKNTVTRVYDEVFKNNPAFKSSLESIIKNLEEYVQALLLSVLLQSEMRYDGFPEFVYEILPEGNVFGGATNELTVKIKIADALKKQPMAMLMLAAVDVSFNRSETKILINEIYGLYFACVEALGEKPLVKEEILFNLISFAKNQGVNI